MLPDVLNARAETAQAIFDLEQADGDEKIARVTLTEAIGSSQRRRSRSMASETRRYPERSLCRSTS